MDIFTGVLLQMDPSHTDKLATGQGHAATKAVRLVILRDLIPLGKIRIEILLAREHADLLHTTTDRQSHSDRVIDSRLI